MRRVLVAAVVVALALVGAPAPAADLIVVTQGGKYLPGDDCANMRPVEAAPCLPVGMTVPAGSTLTYRNLDNDAHTITADEVDENGFPLFESPVLNYNQSGPVAGVSELASGTYSFHCIIHSMTGKLTVI